MISIDAREHIVDTAMKLFCNNGYHSVGIDRIATESGVNEEKISSHFRSKDELILAAMQRRDQQFREWLSTELQQRDSAPREQLLAAFEVLQDWYEQPGFHGCMFINATVEFANKDDPVHVAAARHKQLLYDYVHELTAETGVKNAAELAKQFVLLMEGAIVTTQVTGKPDAAYQARNAVEVLLDLALAA